MDKIYITKSSLISIWKILQSQMRNKMKYIFLFIVMLISINSKTLKKNPDIEYIFSDGNGNSYKLKKNTIYYEPITKDESSSGIYSGGNKTKKKLNYNQSRRLLQLFKKLIKQTDCHIKTRKMTTYLLIYKKDSQKDSTILEGNCPLAKETEDLLKKYISNELEK